MATPTSRREFLRRAGAGFGGLALAALLARDAPAETAARCAAANPLAPRPPHRPARARSVIFCFMDGGPSHIDLFDPKPQLHKLAGKPLPSSFAKPMTAMGSTADTPLLASRPHLQTAWPLRPVGQRLVSGNRHAAPTIWPSCAAAGPTGRRTWPACAR